MKWILYVMLFSTPAANVTNKGDIACLKYQDVKQIKQILVCRPKFEAKRIWSLQATSQFNYTEFESCVRTQDQLMAETNVASTMTLRTWCFCEADKDQCPTDELAGRLAVTYRECEAQGIRDCGAKVAETRQTYLREQQDAVNAANAARPPGTPEAALVSPGRNSSSIRLYPPP